MEGVRPVQLHRNGPVRCLRSDDPAWLVRDQVKELLAAQHPAIGPDVRHRSRCDRRCVHLPHRHCGHSASRRPWLHWINDTHTSSQPLLRSPVSIQRAKRVEKDIREQQQQQAEAKHCLLYRKKFLWTRERLKCNNVPDSQRGLFSLKEDQCLQNQKPIRNLVAWQLASSSGWIKSIISGQKAMRTIEWEE